MYGDPKSQILLEISSIYHLKSRSLCGSLRFWTFFWLKKLLSSWLFNTQLCVYEWSRVFYFAIRRLGKGNTFFSVVIALMRATHLSSRPVLVGNTIVVYVIHTIILLIMMNTHHLLSDESKHILLICSKILTRYNPLR